MDNLITVENGEPMTTSLKIAEAFGKKHKDVLRDIRKRRNEYETELESGGADLRHEILAFEELTYIDDRGKEQVMFKLNKNAMVFTVNKWTSPKATQVQLYYIDAFDTMQKQLEQQSQSFFITEDVDQQAKRIKLENATANTNSRTMNALYRWYKEAQKQGDMEMQEVMRAQVMDMYPGRKATTTAIETTTVVPDASEYYLTATNIANRLGNSVTPEEVGAIANALGLGQHERVQTGSGLAKKFRYNESGFKAIAKYLREN